MTNNKKRNNKFLPGCKNKYISLHGRFLSLFISKIIFSSITLLTGVFSCLGNVFVTKELSRSFVSKKMLSYESSINIKLRSSSDWLHRFKKVLRGFCVVYEFTLLNTKYYLQTTCHFLLMLKLFHCNVNAVTSFLCI